MGIGRITTSGRVIGAGPSPSGRRLFHTCITARRSRPPVEMRSAIPSARLRITSIGTPSGTSEMSHAPMNARGTDPRHSHSTSCLLTVPWRRWTNAPTGFMNRLTTMSLEMAVRGSTPKKNTSIGVMSAPPPMPVSPTMMPTNSPPTTSGRSRVTPSTAP